MPSPFVELFRISAYVPQGRAANVGYGSQADIGTAARFPYLTAYESRPGNWAFPSFISSPPIT